MAGSKVRASHLFFFCVPAIESGGTGCEAVYFGASRNRRGCGSGESRTRYLHSPEFVFIHRASSMEIVKYCHPALRRKSQPLPEISEEFRATVRKMFDMMYEARGIGLAANQVGLPFRFFIVNPTADPNEIDEEMVFINPEIIRKKGSVEGEEGCLSLPEVYGQVPRAEEIVVEAYDIDGEGFELTTDDLLARVIQHESDHLDGVLFFDRMKESDRAEIDSRIKDFEADFRRQQAAGQIPSDAELTKQLNELEKSFEFPD